MNHAPPSAPPSALASTTFLTSSLLTEVGVPHFFSTQHAGDMTASATSETFVNEVVPGRRALVRCRQVHGATVALVTAADSTNPPEADGLVTDDPTSVVAIRTADCVPVLIATDDGHVVAAIHAGWRGVVAGVVPRAIECMRARTVRPLVAAIGPCILQDAFEVGPEVVAEFRKVFGANTDSFVKTGRADRSHLDLVESLRLQVRPFAITLDTSAAHCTVKGVGRFYSYRRDAGKAGRMLSGIGTR